jgi:hypothetical protein
MGRRTGPALKRNHPDGPSKATPHSCSLGVPCRGVAGLMVAFLIPLPFPQTSPRPDGRAWRELLAGFRERGVAVVTTHPRCREPDLVGLYVRGRTEVVICPRGEPSTTLRHEGWHLVQHLCLVGSTWLAPQTVEARLSRGDRRELELLVSPERRPREAEARVMAQLPPQAYLQAVDRACAGRLPFKTLPQAHLQPSAPPAPQPFPNLGAPVATVWP